MFGLGSFSRRTEPRLGGCALAEARAPSAIEPTAWLPSELEPGAPKVAVWESLVSWHLGEGCSLPAEQDSASVSDAELAGASSIFFASPSLFFFFADPDDSGDAEEGDPDEVGVAAIRILLAAAAAGDRAVCRWASAASACWPLSSAC